MKKTDNTPNEKQPMPAKPEGMTELTDQDLQQVQGGLANQAPVEKSKKGGGGTTSTPK